MSVLAQTLFYYMALIVAALALFVAWANPYRLRRQVTGAVRRILPADRRQELDGLADSWAGKVRMTAGQQRLLMLLGGIVGLLPGLVLWGVTGQLLQGLLLGTVGAGAMGLLPGRRFVAGYPKKWLRQLEGEAPSLASFAYESVGLSGLPLPAALNQYSQAYRHTATAKLLADVPPGLPPAAALLALEISPQVATDWLEVVTTLQDIPDLGEKRLLLWKLRNTMWDRADKKQALLVRQKAFQAPMAMAVLLLWPLLALLLVPALSHALSIVGGSL